MKMKKSITLIFVLAATAFSTALPAADSAEMAAFKQAIRAKYDMKEKAFAEHDPETILTQFYSEDVISVGEGEHIIRGRDELRGLYTEIARTHPHRVKVVSFSTKVEGDLGWDWADFSVTPEDPSKAPFAMKILFLWERRDGEWICTGDMFVIDRPAANVEATTSAERKE